MRYASIKFFPSDKVDYISHYFLNFFFSLIFIFNIPYLNILLFGKNNPSYTLLIPVTDDSFEENKDLIFTKLSVNETILSVKKIEKKIILEKINKRLNTEVFDEELIPEVFEIITKNNKRLDVKRENKNLKEIIEGAEILEKNIQEKIEIFKSFLIVFFSVIFFIIFLSILKIHYLKKLKLFLIKSRTYGAKDSTLIFNISLGYFIFQVLGILTGYFCIHFLETNFKIPSFYFFINIETIIIFNLIQNIICILSFYYSLKTQLGKVM